MERWYVEHLEAYAEATKWTLEQVYLPRDQRAPDNFLQALEQNRVGDFTWSEHSRFPRYLQNQDMEAIAARFGQHVADAVAEASANSWFGPVLSPHGSHYLRVVAEKSGEVPDFEKLSGYIERDWREAQMERAVDRALTSLREQYSVRQVD
ncbi:peptidylprolyl isomerase [Allohahella marinimesophila]|uniref:PpiC domain-containing protein n=1 Tax=Allohahella marinimesophila TaxID=1054972 RepID=A0ABP7NXY5_9GAMM